MTSDVVCYYKQLLILAYPDLRSRKRNFTGRRRGGY